MKAFEDLVRPKNDVLQAAIEARVKDLDSHLTEPEKYRSLVELGDAHRATVTPEQFRLRLLAAGLPRPRASEIKTILAADSGNVAKQFLADPNLGIRQALALARARKGSGGERSRPSTDSRRVRRLIVRALEGLLHELAKSRTDRPLDCGLFHIRFTQITPS